MWHKAQVRTAHLNVGCTYGISDFRYGANILACRRRHCRVASELGGGRNFSPPSKDQGLLDGNALWQYLQLPCSMQTRLAAGIGADRHAILQALDSLGGRLLVV